MPRSKFFVVCNFWSINSQWFSKWVEKVDTTSLYYFDFKIFQNDSEKISPIRNSGVMINWFSATAWKLRPNTTLHLLKVSRRVKFLFFKKPYIVKFVSSECAANYFEIHQEQFHNWGFPRNLRAFRNFRICVHDFCCSWNQPALNFTALSKKIIHVFYRRFADIFYRKIYQQNFVVIFVM